MRHPVVQAETAHGIHLVFHQCNQGGYYNGRTLLDKGRQLVAEGLTTPGGHQDKCVTAGQDISMNRFNAAMETGQDIGYNFFLVSLKSVKTKILLQIRVKYLSNILHHPVQL